MATLLITSHAQQEFQRLPTVVRARIEKLLVRLENWPNVSGAKPLRGKLVGCYRMRSGDYRIQFQVAADVVTVEKIGHRDGFYGD